MEEKKNVVSVYGDEVQSLDELLDVMFQVNLRRIREQTLLRARSILHPPLDDETCGTAL
jgi:hypothetical protein